MLRRALCLLAVHAVAAAPGFAQEPQTRAEGLAQEREAKQQRLVAPQRNGVERALLALENGRLFERLLNPPEGFYPKIGNITPGSGFSGGPGYRHPGVFGGHADFSAFAMGSLQRYWMIDARLTLPRIAKGRAFVETHGQVYDFPEEDYFGLGPDSRREDESTFGLRSTQVGASAGIRASPWLSFSGSVDHLTPRIRSGDQRNAIDVLFNPATVPGRLSQPDFIRSELMADFNYRTPRGNPRGGGRYTLRYQHFDDRELDRYSFGRVEADLQQYISLLRNRRVLALRALASVSNAETNHEVPFYFQRTLGGPDDLRGFRRFRFRDRNLLLLQAEYRWEIFTAVDGVIFYDAGKVAARREDLDLKDLESDYGIGFRFGTVNGVFLRIEGAFGSSGGKHFILRFSNVF